MSQQDITAKTDAQALSAEITSVELRAHATPHSLGARVAALQEAFRHESQQAFDKAPGREQDVLTLMMEEAMGRPRTEATDALRTELGLPYPIHPSANELGRLSRMLYTVHGLDTAFVSEAGG